MDDYSLSRDELVFLVIGAFVAVVIPSWVAIFRSRRKARLTGYRPRAHGYSPSSVLMCLVPMTGALLVWFLLSAGALSMVHEHLSPKLMGGMPFILGILDLAALVTALHLCMPQGYLQYLQDTPKGMHSPLDLLLSVIFFPGALLQIGYVIGLGGE